MHEVLSARGVKHLDNEFSDPSWIPYSDTHLVERSLGALADLHRDVLLEYDVEDESVLLPSLGILRAKAGDFKGAKELFT